MARAYRNYLLSFYEEKYNRKRQRGEIRDLCDPYDLPDNEFLENFKVSREMVDYLCDELEEDLAPKHSSGLSVEYIVMSSLKVALSGHYQRGIGNEHFMDIAQTTVSKYLSQFLDSVNRRLMPHWIQFPGSETSRAQVSAGFQEKFGLPHILGCVDCTHVKLFPPPKVIQTQFRNRSRVVTLNVQLVSDAQCRILNVNANFPGRVHDQFIFNASNVKAEMRRLHERRIGQYYLLGDSGYALEPWLLTPIRDAEHGSPEYRYTAWHCQTRNSIERTNGYLKGTFRCLGTDRSLHYSPEQASKIVYACCTLYNIMKHFRVPMEFLECDPEVTEPNDYEPNVGLYQLAIQKRAQVIQDHFL